MTEEELREIGARLQEAIGDNNVGIPAVGCTCSLCFCSREVPRLFAEIRRLNTEIRTLNGRISDMALGCEVDEPVKGGSPSPDAASIPNGWGSKL